MRIHVRIFLSVLFVGAGLCLVFYPWISNLVYRHKVDSSVEVYRKELMDADSEELKAIMVTAQRYNNLLAESKAALTDPFIFPETEASDLTYESVLSLDGSGLMCFVEIPKIDVHLPVYHGTSEEVLEKGVGHLEGSSVPVGGEGTHAVLSAHTGMNSAKMFTDLTEMKEGDLFFIHVVGVTLAYRVCEIQVILPEDTGSLVIKEGRDLISLITCTPYGVNSHRLVVTGERTECLDEIIEESENADPDSKWMKAYRKAILTGLGAVILFIFIPKLYRYTAKKFQHNQQISVCQRNQSKKK